MSAAACEAVREIVEPLLPGWLVQLGAWDDSRDQAKVERYAVIRPAGGPFDGLVRRPSLSLYLIGRAGGDVLEVQRAADSIVETLRTQSGRVVHLQAAEPAFMPTADRRPVFDIAIQAITN